ncbi:hypothetical protein AOQ72_17245 [Bradyrhizobium yuanmingense]|uniref:Uncharacterized protein n=1 Tax=Bradyrhizobium yuanmingense TaxID=108015 RepID=A0A0R3CJ52_9BRAD|nr:hypothetical protein [Bradyrhizobium yuanmingense]KRP97626.1 hypothetical protein AOQ72_17245 [Bradyrhizobium yuanmingense]
MKSSRIASGRNGEDVYVGTRRGRKKHVQDDDGEASCESFTNYAVSMGDVAKAQIDVLSMTGSILDDWLLEHNLNIWDPGGLLLDRISPRATDRTLNRRAM